MKIIVCIKQVPDTTEIKIDPETNTLIREGVESIVNPFDLHAVEEALKIKENSGDGQVIAISMGPPQTKDALKEVIAMGVDKAYLLSAKEFAGADTLATSYTLSMAIKNLGSYDLIICGKQAIDGDTAQVGPGLAGQLNIPQITYVKKIEKIDVTSVRVQRMTEEGYEIIETPLPALLTVIKDINIPRLPTLRGKLIAKKIEIPVLSSQDIGADLEKIGLSGSPTQVIKVFSPEIKKESKIFSEDVENGVDKVAQALKEIVEKIQ
ncbi:MAG: electron transfer flavoprotein subunit beta/FixA family protein [Candidatus Cloacimonadota bacterium]|nr:MAG: electron transfer flavoprotein subunit beta/FixA family protein [Candidatus Cloacimonadota bacterium]